MNQTKNLKNQNEKNLKNLQKSLEKNLGADIKFEKTKLPVDRDYNQAVDRFGTSITPTGMKYAGSMTICMFVSDFQLTVNGGHVAAATNFTQKIPLGLDAVYGILEKAKVDILAHHMPAFEANEAKGE